MFDDCRVQAEGLAYAVYLLLSVIVRYTRIIAMQ